LKTSVGWVFDSVNNRLFSVFNIIVNQTTADSGFFRGREKKNPTLVPVISETNLIALAVFIQELGKNGWLSVFLIFFG
jgi:hypothetical protein